MKKQTIKKYTITALSLFLSFGISYGVMSVVFPYGTPQVRQNLSAYLLNSINPLQWGNKNNKNLVAFEEEYDAILFQPIASGVEAKTYGHKASQRINLDELDLVEYTVVVNGKERTFLIPRGTDAPPLELLEQIIIE